MKNNKTPKSYSPNSDSNDILSNEINNEKINKSSAWNTSEEKKKIWADSYFGNKNTNYYKWSQQFMFMLIVLCIISIVLLMCGFFIDAKPVVWGLNWMIFTSFILLAIWLIFCVSSYYFLRKIYRRERNAYGYNEIFEKIDKPIRKL